MTEVNVPLLRKTLEWAHGEWQKKRRGEVSEWDQAVWMASTAALHGYDAKVFEAFKAGTACGTTCCIAGKVALDAGWHHGFRSHLGGTVYREGEYRSTESVAMELLGLDSDTAFRLFNGVNSIYSLYAVAAEITGGEIQMPPELMEAVDVQPADE